MVSRIEDGGRFRFHDLTREYARAQAAAELPRDERDQAELRVYRALLTLIRNAHAALYGGDFEVVHSDVPDVDVPQPALDEARGTPSVWFERERPNVRAAVVRAAALGSAGLCWDLAVSAHEFYTIGEYFDDWRVTHEVALAAARTAGDRRGEGVVLTMLGQPPLVASGSSGVSGVPELEEAVRLLGRAGERHGQAIALRTLGNALRRRGELTRPLQLFKAALDHYRAGGDTVGALQTLRFLGQTYLDLGDAGRALRMFRAAEEMARDLDGPRVLAQTRYWVGRAALARGDLPAARTAFGDVLAAFPSFRGLGHAYARHALGDLALAEGDAGGAHLHLSQAAILAREGADGVLEGRIAQSIASIEQRRGHRAKELLALLHAVGRFQSCGAVHLEVRAQESLAEAYAAAGDAEAAAAARDRIVDLHALVPKKDRLIWH
jgi:tetratricopeptide (TPR) repeat protein